MNLTVFTGDTKTVYRLPVGRSLDEAVAEAKRHHPSFTRIKIIVNANKEPHTMPQGGRT